MKRVTPSGRQGTKERPKAEGGPKTLGKNHQKIRTHPKDKLKN